MEKSTNVNKFNLKEKPFRNVHISGNVKFNEKEYCIIIVKSKQNFEELIGRAIIKMIPKEVTEIMVINQEYIIEAIKEKMERDSRNV